MWKGRNVGGGVSEGMEGESARQSSSGEVKQHSPGHALRTWSRTGSTTPLRWVQSTDAAAAVGAAGAGVPVGEGVEDAEGNEVRDGDGSGEGSAVGVPVPELVPVGVGVPVAVELGDAVTVELEDGVLDADASRDDSGGGGGGGNDGAPVDVLVVDGTAGNDGMGAGV